MKLLIGLLLLFFGQGVSTMIHSLQYFYTASSGLSSFPEYVEVGMMDGVQFYYYDSISRRAEPKQAWIDQVTRDDPHYLERNTGRAQGNQQAHKASINNLKQRFNQTGERPQVSLLQRTPSSPVGCHATGFYPDRVVVFWTREDQEVYENVDQGRVLPNHDGTFQVSVDLDLTSVPKEDWGRYQCVVQLKGIEDIFTPLDPARIRTNWGKTGLERDGAEEHQSDFTIPIIIISVALLLAAAAAVGFVRYKKRNGSDGRTKPTEEQAPAQEVLALTTRDEDES